MKKKPWLLLVFVLLIQADIATGQSPGSKRDDVTIDVMGPLIVGFFPPFTDAERASDDGGISEGLAHVRFALEDIAACYTEKSAVFRLEIARSITLRDGKVIRRIR